MKKYNHRLFSIKTIAFSFPTTFLQSIFSKNIFFLKLLSTVKYKLFLMKSSFLILSTQGIKNFFLYHTLLHFLYHDPKPEIIFYKPVSFDSDHASKLK